MDSGAKCARKISRSDRRFHTTSTRCKNKGILEHGGELYCRLHHPPTMEERRNLKYTAWKEKYDEKNDESRFKEICAEVGLEFLKQGNSPGNSLSEKDVALIKRKLNL